MKRRLVLLAGVIAIGLSSAGCAGDKCADAGSCSGQVTGGTGGGSPQLPAAGAAGATG